MSVTLIKDTRKHIDSILLALSEGRIDTRELSLVYTALQLSQMWMGKALGELGEPNPYPKSTDSASPVIEEKADSAIEPFPLLSGRVPGIKNLRSIIQTISEDIASSLIDAPALKIAMNYLQEAKMWLGMELNTIKKRAEFLLGTEETYQKIKLEEAEKAYQRYREQQDNGAQMPLFADLVETSRKGWIDAVLPYIQSPAQIGLNASKTDKWDREAKVVDGPGTMRKVQ